MKAILIRFFKKQNVICIYLYFRFSTHTITCIAPLKIQNISIQNPNSLSQTFHMSFPNLSEIPTRRFSIPFPHLVSNIHSSLPHPSFSSKQICLSLPSFYPSLYTSIFLLFQTVSVSMLLRYSHHQIFVFIGESSFDFSASPRTCLSFHVCAWHFGLRGPKVPRDRFKGQPEFLWRC